jgi:glycosyltransferase involved in cell wall biosynthesis
VSRRPENCAFREPSESPDAAVCRLLGRVLGVSDRELSLVERDACVVCCRSMRQAEQINPVIASLAYNAATKIVRMGGHAECSVDRARQLIACATDNVGVVLSEFQDRSFPPEASPYSENQVRGLTWAVGLTTAPRPNPTIERTLSSLQAAGFETIHIFAEPGTRLPRPSNHLPVVVNPQRLGTLLNLYSSLAALLASLPSADAFAVFQDDIDAAHGLKQWCDEQFWPLDASVVSLFTPRLHSGSSPGWRLLSPGYQRACGAQALVFRRDAVHEFLSDPLVMNRLQAKGNNNDAVVAGWTARHGRSIAYHTPSLVQHLGHQSSIYTAGPDRRNFAHAVSSVEEIATWKPSASRKATIGLVGWDTTTGLGHLNYDLAAHLGINRWLIPPHPRLPAADRPSVNVRRDVMETRPGDQQLKTWLRGLDWLLFVERPILPNLVRLAAHSGVGIACVPMWEWLQPDLAWLQFVDLMICPTRHAFLQMVDWKRRYGFGWDAIHVSWPIDAERFRFRERQRCQRFLYVNGWGGAEIHRLDGTKPPYARKGIDFIVEAAGLAPSLSFVVYSQATAHLDLPKNIEWRTGPARNADLYHDGDVCVQPSRFEGLGLPLLECQAAGLPLITTDAPPMNEYEPLRTIPVSGSEIVVGGGLIAAQIINPRDLVDTLLPFVDTDIRAASRQARDYILTQHSWDSAVGQLRHAMAQR